MKLSAKADYAVRAVLVLAAHEGPGPMKGELIAGSQKLPLKFVENILGELKHAGIVVSQRGPEGGYQLAVPPETLSVAEVIRVVDGPLAAVAGMRPEMVSYPPGAEALPRCVAGGAHGAAGGARADHVRRSGRTVEAGRGDARGGRCRISRRT